MDASRFDIIARSLGAAGSRRRALGGLLVGALGLFGSQADDAAAKKKPCPPCKKRKAGKCKKKRPDGTVCPGGSCQSGRCIATVEPPSGPICIADGIKNGSETDVDCGGGCGRCMKGLTCATGDDCETAYCSGSVCANCGGDFVPCDPFRNGRCTCRTPIGASERYCTRNKPERIDNNLNCGGSCPAGTYCLQFSGTQSSCHRPCQAGNLPVGDQ